MKNVFAASLWCKDGILGGGIYVEPGQIRYRTGKVTISKELKDFTMPFSDIVGIFEGRAVLIYPTFSIRMADGSRYKFIIFAKRRFIKALREAGLKL